MTLGAGPRNPEKDWDHGRSIAHKIVNELKWAHKTYSIRQLAEAVSEDETSVGVFVRGLARDDPGLPELHGWVEMVDDHHCRLTGAAESRAVEEIDRIEEELPHED